MLTHAVMGISLQNPVEFTEVAIKGCTMTSVVENVPSSQSLNIGREWVGTQYSEGWEGEAEGHCGAAFWKMEGDDGEGFHHSWVY